jgi:hypothetical protein
VLVRRDRVAREDRNARERHLVSTTEADVDRSIERILHRPRLVRFVDRSPLIPLCQLLRQCRRRVV